jgi:hypothetical protein
MDIQTLREEIDHAKELIKIHIKTLRVLEKQAAKFSIHVPSYIQVEMDDINKDIQKTNKIIKIKELIIASQNNINMCKSSIDSFTLLINKSTEYIASNDLEDIELETYKTMMKSLIDQRDSIIEIMDRRSSSMRLWIQELSKLES